MYLHVSVHVCSCWIRIHAIEVDPFDVSYPRRRSSLVENLRNSANVHRLNERSFPTLCPVAYVSCTVRANRFCEGMRRFTTTPLKRVILRFNRAPKSMKIQTQNYHRHAMLYDVVEIDEFHAGR